MAYTKTIWENGKTPLNDKNLNHIEEGIESNSLKIEALENNLVPIATDNIVGGITAKAKTEEQNEEIGIDKLSGKVYTKHIPDELVSGETIKTINGQNVLGKGDLKIKPLTSDFTTDENISIYEENYKVGFKLKQTFLDKLLTKDLLGKSEGVAQLSTDGKIPASQLPNYIDSTIEYKSKNEFPVDGETNKVYVALDTNKVYRWSGSQYIEIGKDLALGETSSTAYSGDKGKQNRDDINALLNGSKSSNKATNDGNGNNIVNTYETKTNASAKLQEAKSYTDTQLKTITDNIVKDVICSHQYEITGNTGDEHGLAVEDQQMLIKKIEGQTKVVNGYLANSNCVLKSSGRNLIDISKPAQTMADIYATENSIVYTGSKPLTKMACSLFNKQGQYKDYFGLNGAKGCKITQENSQIYFAFYSSETQWHLARYDVSHLAGFTIYVMATENLSAKTFSDVRIVYQKTPYEPYKEDTIDGIGSLGQFDYVDMISQKKVLQTSDIVTLNGSENWFLTQGYFTADIITKNDCNNSVNSINVVSNKLTSDTADRTANNKVDNVISAFGNKVLIRINSITTVEQLKQHLASNPIQLVYKKATPTTIPINLPSGYAVYNGGLQSQIGDVPYKITKQYNLSQKAQTLANIEIDREQQALIDNLTTIIESLKKEVEQLKTQITPKEVI